MKLSRSNYCFLLFLMLVSGAATAQEANFNRMSLEITTGIHIPNSPNNEISNSKYIAFKQFQLSGRYMFSEQFGVKGHYGFNGFSNPDNNDEGVNANRIGLEGVVNVGRLLNVDYSVREKVGLLFHGGVGLTSAKPSVGGTAERMGNLLAGLTGEVKLSNRFALLVDATYVANFSQHYNFNGVPLDPKTNSGGFMNLSVGIMYSLGSKSHHADWY